MNNASSGREVVEGFLKTSMANYTNDSKEMLSYMLPSFLARNNPEKVNFYDFSWKYNIEKTQGNNFYVALFTIPNNKSACKLVTFQTQQENGYWYLVPTTNSYSKRYVNPWAICSNGDSYLPGSGPYEDLDTKKNEETSLSEFNFLDNTEINTLSRQKEQKIITKKMAMAMAITQIKELEQNEGYTVLREKTYDKRPNQLDISIELFKDELKDYSVIVGVMVYDLDDHYVPPTMIYRTKRKGYRNENTNKTGTVNGAIPSIKTSMIGVRFDYRNLDSVYFEFYNLIKGTYYILAK